MTGFIELFDTARDYILQLTYSLVAVEIWLFSESLPNNRGRCLATGLNATI
jgi:hypothetical protein